MLPAITDAARQHALRHPFAETTIELGCLGPEAMTLGAATLPVERFLNSALHGVRARAAVGQPAFGRRSRGNTPLTLTDPGRLSA